MYDFGRIVFEEGMEVFFFLDGFGGVVEVGVLGVVFVGFDLEMGFDDVVWGGEIGGGYIGDGIGSEELKNIEFFGLGFVKEVFF